MLRAFIQTIFADAPGLQEILCHLVIEAAHLDDLVLEVAFVPLLRVSRAACGTRGRASALREALVAGAMCMGFATCAFETGIAAATSIPK